MTNLPAPLYRARNMPESLLDDPHLGLSSSAFRVCLSRKTLLRLGKTIHVGPIGKNHATT